MVQLTTFVVINFRLGIQFSYPTNRKEKSSFIYIYIFLIFFLGKRNIKLQVILGSTNIFDHPL